MGAGRSKPFAMQQSNRAYQTFYEMFRNTHSYLTENEVEPNAVMTWAAMSHAQKSQFQDLEVPAHAHMQSETLPNSNEECYKSVSAKKERTKVKYRPKRKPKPKPVKATAARTKTLKANKKSNKVLNSTSKGKLKKRKARTNKRNAANNTNTTRK